MHLHDKCFLCLPCDLRLLDIWKGASLATHDRLHKGHELATRVLRVSSWLELLHDSCTDVLVEPLQDLNSLCTQTPMCNELFHLSQSIPCMHRRTAHRESSGRGTSRSGARHYSF